MFLEQCQDAGLAGEVGGADRDQAAAALTEEGEDTLGHDTAAQGQDGGEDRAEFGGALQLGGQVVFESIEISS